VDLLRCRLADLRVNWQHQCVSPYSLFWHDLLQQGVYHTYRAVESVLLCYYNLVMYILLWYWRFCCVAVCTGGFLFSFSVLCLIRMIILYMFMYIYICSSQYNFTWYMLLDIHVVRVCWIGFRSARYIVDVAGRCSLFCTVVGAMWVLAACRRNGGLG
jgi:hypothetical protein